MKKILTFCLIALLILYVTPLVSSASENTTSEEWIIQIDIHEFLNNKDYYTSLTRQGYGLCITLGKEYSDSEVRNMFDLPGSPHRSSGISTYGTSLPTETYNIHTSPNYTVAYTLSNYSIIYSGKRFTGCTDYAINLFNYKYDNPLKITVYDTRDGTIYYSLAARSYLCLPVHTNSSTDSFFFALSPPCETDGYVTCCLAQ